jgi:hypothetical protein
MVAQGHQENKPRRKDLTFKCFEGAQKGGMLTW